MGTLGGARSTEGRDELVWAIVYREGPLTREALVQQTHVDSSDLEKILERLVTSGRIERSTDGVDATFRAKSLYVHLGTPGGWEAAVFDHYQAMVKTILCRLREDRTVPSVADQVGGSTYTLDVWAGHPLEELAQDTLKRLRTTLVALREQVEAFNAEHERPEKYTQVVLYVGQCLISQDGADNSES